MARRLVTYQWSVAVHAVDLGQRRTLCGRMPKVAGVLAEMESMMNIPSPEGWGWGEFTGPAGVTCRWCAEYLREPDERDFRGLMAEGKPWGQPRSGRWPQQWWCMFPGCEATAPAVGRIQGGACPLPPGWGRRTTRRVLCPEHFTDSRPVWTCRECGKKGLGGRGGADWSLPPGWREGITSQAHDPVAKRRIGKGRRYFCEEHAHLADIPPKPPWRPRDPSLGPKPKKVSDFAWRARYRPPKKT